MALLNYYGQDCPEAQYAAKEASKDMAKPRVGSWVKVKRVVRFLMGRRAVVWRFGWQDEGQEIRVYTDSDWGGSRGDRRSTSGGVVMYGDHCWKTWSTTQGAVALSSAEAEFYGMVEGTLRGKWAATVAREIGVDVEVERLVVRTDSEAARSFVSRRGLGRMRHIEVRELWLQEEVRKGGVEVGRVAGEDNPADLMTKYHGSKEVIRRLRMMYIEWEQAPSHPKS